MERGVCQVAYGVSPIPERKRIALYRSCGPEIKVVSYFESEADAREFMAFIDRLVMFSTSEPVDEWHGWAEIKR